jgi:Dolichyl-phosphate-mannose-protein mannosyltransferase
MQNRTKRHAQLGQAAGTLESLPGASADIATRSAATPSRVHDKMRYWCAAGALAVVAGLAYDAIPDLPVAPQSDEPKKADFVLSGRQDFLQPLLLLQVVRLANLFAQQTDQAAVVGLGRTVAAVFGGLTVLATVVLARRLVGRGLALAAGVVAAVTPLVAFHAQLFKEDIVVAPWLLFALAALDRLRENVELRRALVFGIMVGLATSAKYVGVILLPVACLLPLIAPPTGVSLRGYYAELGWSAGTAVAVFALVNAPAFLTPDILLHGLKTEIAHAVTKHIIVWHGWYSYFLFHWTTSLWPGLGPTLAAAGLAAALLVVTDWRSSPPAIRLVLVFAMLWYLMHELSPMKPFMATERHMTVMGGLFAILAVYLADHLCGRAARPWRVAIATCIVGIVAAPAALSTIAIARSAPNDTRSVVERVRAALDGRDAVDWYATFPGYKNYPPLTTIEGATDYVVLVQETADRFAQSGAFAHQSDLVRGYARAYDELLAQPAIVVESTAGRFSYRNVPLRVVALRSNAARLEAVLAKLGPLPQTRLTVVPGRASAARARGAINDGHPFWRTAQ